MALFQFILKTCWPDHIQYLQHFKSLCQRTVSSRPAQPIWLCHFLNENLHNYILPLTCFIFPNTTGLPSFHETDELVCMRISCCQIREVQTWRRAMWVPQKIVRVIRSAQFKRFQFLFCFSQQILPFWTSALRLEPLPFLYSFYSFLSFLVVISTAFRWSSVNRRILLPLHCDILTDQNSFYHPLLVLTVLNFTTWTHKVKHSTSTRCCRNPSAAMCGLSLLGHSYMVFSWLLFTADAGCGSWRPSLNE